MTMIASDFFLVFMSLSAAPSSRNSHILAEKKVFLKNTLEQFQRPKRNRLQYQFGP